jgi:hypothetical protein
LALRHTKNRSLDPSRPDLFMSRIKSVIREHPSAAAAVGVGAVAVVAFILLWFEPQALLIDKRIDEDLPGSVDVGDAGTRGQGGGKVSGRAEEAASPAPEVVTRGRLRGINHAASGDVLLVRLSDGSHILRFEDLMAENGPDLRVYLSAAPASSDGPAFNDDYVELGPLKGNIGNQNYGITDDVDLSTYRTPVIWCKRFEVGFAVAGLH